VRVFAYNGLYSAACQFTGDLCAPTASTRAFAVAA
jgi:hypothetical protein